MMHTLHPLSDDNLATANATSNAQLNITYPSCVLDQIAAGQTIQLTEQ